MLPRVLEPEVMDTVEEAVDYDAMDHSEVNCVFVEDFLAVWDEKYPLLDVGTGTAQIPIALCQKHHSTTVTGIDLAEQMLEVGRKNVKSAEFTDRIALECVDAKQMPYPEGKFAGVISNSIAHHIPEPSLVFEEMVRVVVPGGWLFVRDLLRPDDAATLDALVEQYAGDCNAHQQKMFRESLHAALTIEEVQAIVVPLGFSASSVRATSDRHWTWSARKSS